MTAVASLGMYDHPGQRAANDRIWAGMAHILRGCGIARVPDSLERGRTLHAIWHDADLLFGQVCGYPLVTDKTLSLRVLAQPIYAVPGCRSDSHRSILVVRRDELGSLDAFRGRRAAINARNSNTGMNLFRATVAPIAEGRPFFARVEETGSHRDSILAIVRGEADIAAIDTVTFAALVRFEPALTSALRIVARSPTSPTLPFVTGRASSDETVQALFAALTHVIADPGLADARADLFLTGMTPATDNRFVPLAEMAGAAATAGYAELR